MPESVLEYARTVEAEQLTDELHDFLQSQHYLTTIGETTARGFEVHPISHWVICDDDELFVRSFTTILELNPARRVALTASSGEELLSQLLHIAPPDVIMCDLHMPDPDGCAVAEALTRSRYCHVNQVRLIALTGDVTPRTVGRAYACGFHQVIGKNELLNTLTALVPWAWPAAVGGVTTP